MGNFGKQLLFKFFKLLGFFVEFSLAVQNEGFYTDPIYATCSTPCSFPTGDCLVLPSQKNHHRSRISVSAIFLHSEFALTQVSLRSDFLLGY